MYELLSFRGIGEGGIYIVREILKCYSTIILINYADE